MPVVVEGVALRFFRPRRAPTTVVDLPAHARPLTTSARLLRRKVEATEGRLHADVGFWAAALPENVEVERLKSELAGK